MKARRAAFLLFWLLSLWALLYSGKAVYFYAFFLFAGVFLLSVLQLVLSILSFGMRTNFSRRPVEKNRPFVWKLLPQARTLPVAHARVRLTFPDLSTVPDRHPEFGVSLPFGRKIPLPVEFRSPYAGTFPLTAESVTFTDIFGLWRVRLRADRFLRNNTVQVSVLPDTSVSLRTERLYDDILLPTRRTPERAEAVGIREYRRGDMMRTVHWKYSARMGKLHVKEYEIGYRELHLVYLDLTECPLSGEAAAMAKDYLLCSAASFCRMLLREQIPMRILGYSTKDPGRFPLNGIHQWEAARRYLAGREFAAVIPSEYKGTIAAHILRDKATMTVFTMAADPTSLSFLTEKGGNYSSVSICIIPQPGHTDEQAALLRLLSGRGIHPLLLPERAPERTREVTRDVPQKARRKAAKDRPREVTPP